MVYYFRCLLPYDRKLTKSDCLSTTADLFTDFETKELSVKHDTLDKLGESLGFIYTQQLIFLYERDFRNTELWSIDLNSFESSYSLGWIHYLDNGEVIDNLIVKYVGLVNNVDMGYGLFCETFIKEGSFIGEYVGILKASSKCCPPSRYSLLYPSSDGDYEIDALEYGNEIRFINHSNKPNAKFMQIFHNGIVHIVCVSLIDIVAGSELLVDYGPSYWRGHTDFITKN